MYAEFDETLVNGNQCSLQSRHWVTLQTTLISIFQLKKNFRKRSDTRELLNISRNMKNSVRSFPNFTLCSRKRKVRPRLSLRRFRRMSLTGFITISKDLTVLLQSTRI